MPTGSTLPASLDEFTRNRAQMKHLACIDCHTPFNSLNVHTYLGWKETQISGLCEDCFDNLFDDALVLCEEEIRLAGV